MFGEHPWKMCLDVYSTDVFLHLHRGFAREFNLPSAQDAARQDGQVGIVQSFQKVMAISRLGNIDIF